MLLSTLIAGFVLGAAGSLHCIGMCGPLSLALPVMHLSNTARFLSLLLYQFGRIITYSVLGLITGLAGRGFYMAGFQQWFSVIAGSLILVSALFYFIQKRGGRFRFFQRYYANVYKLISSVLRSNKSSGSFLLLGLANGLLPCGMVYIALATALSFPRVSDSTGFMAMFGAGTLPAMMLIGYGGQIINPGIRNLFRKATPYVIALMGIVLILRGLNLGILFLSPQLPGASSAAAGCHQ